MVSFVGTPAVFVTASYVVRTPFTLLRFSRLNASAMSCTRAPAKRPISFVTRGSTENWLGSRNELRAKPGARSLRALPSLLISVLTTAEYGWPVCQLAMPLIVQPPRIARLNPFMCCEYESRLQTPLRTTRFGTSLSPGAQSPCRLRGSCANFASSVPGTTAVASGLSSRTFERVYARRICQLFEKRFWISTVRPLYCEFALDWNCRMRAKFVNGRPV